MSADPKTSLFELEVGALRDQTASSAPTPGGGSVSCVSATLGLGLVIMAVEITAKSAADAELTEWIARARAKLGELSRHADRDVEVFDGYMRAHALPRSGDTERAVRKEAMKAATIACTEAPLAAGEDMLRALELAREITPRVKRNVLSDVLAGADLLGGAIAALLRSVDVNLPGISDAALAARFAADRARVADRGRALRDEIVEIAARLG